MPQQGKITVPPQPMLGAETPSLNLEQERDQFYADRRQRIADLRRRNNDVGARSLAIDEMVDAKTQEVVSELSGQDPLQDTGGIQNMSEEVLVDRAARLYGQRMQVADLELQDPDWQLAQQELGNLSKQVAERNAQLFEARKKSPHMSPVEFMSQFEPVAVAEEQRQRWSAALTGIDQKLKAIDKTWSVWTHPKTEKIAKALTGVHGVAPWHQTMKGEAGLFRPEGTRTDIQQVAPSREELKPQLVEEEVPGEVGGFDLEGRPNMGPTFRNRRETPQEVKERTGQVYQEEQLSGPDVGFRAARRAAEGMVGKTAVASAEAFVHGAADVLIGGTVTAAKHAWNLGSTVAYGLSGGDTDAMGWNPFQVPQDWVYNSKTQSYDPVDMPMGIPELAMGVSVHGLHEQLMQEVEGERGRLALHATADQEWYQWLAVNSSAFLGGITGFGMMSGALLAKGGALGQKLAVPRGTLVKGMARVLTGEGTRAIRIRGAIGSVLGQAVALGGYEAATSASTPQELAERFKHGAMMAPVFIAAGKMGGKAEELLRRRRMPRVVSRAIGGALEGTVFSAYEAVSGEGTAPLFGKTAEGESLWSFFKNPSSEKLEGFLRTMAINMTGMAMHKMLGKAGPVDEQLHREELRRRIETQKARSEVRFSMEREEIARISGEQAAMEKSGRAFEREALPELFRRKHGEAFKEIGKQLKEEAGLVSKLEQHGPFVPSQRALLDQLGKTKREKGAIEFEAAPNLFARLGNVVKQRLLRRAKAKAEGWEGERIAGELGVILTREGGKVSGKAFFGESAPVEEWVSGGKGPNVPGKRWQEHGLKPGSEQVTIHEHPSSSPFSEGDAMFYLANSLTQHPQFVVTREGVHSFVKSEAAGQMIDRPNLGDFLPPGVQEKVLRAEPLSREERAQLHEASLKHGVGIAEWARSLGFKYEKLTFQEAQRRVDEWAKSGQMPGETPPPSPSELKATEEFRRLGVSEPDVVPTKPVERAEVQQTVDDWFRREGERYESERGHPAALFEGTVVEKAPISAAKDRAFIEPAIKRLFDELEPLASGLSGLAPTPANLVKVMRSLGVSGRTPRGILLRTAKQDASMRTDRAAASREVEAFQRSLRGTEAGTEAPKPKAPLSPDQQERALDTMFSAQKESDLYRDYRPWKVRMTEQLATWKKRLSSLKGIFSKGSREKAAQWVEKLGLRGQRAKLAKEHEPLITAELDRLMEGFTGAKYESGSDIYSAFLPLEVVPDLVKRQDLTHKTIEYAMLRDLAASHQRVFTDAQGKQVTRDTPLPAGVSIDAVKERIAKIEGSEDFGLIGDSYRGIREILDAAFNSMVDRGLATPEMHRPDYYPRRIADFGELYSSVMGEPTAGRVRERSRGYMKLRGGSERLLDPRPEVLRDYLMKVRIDNEIHDFYDRVGSEISSRELDKLGLSLGQIEKMSQEDWTQLRRQLDDQGLVVIDTRAGTLGRHKVEQHPAFAQILTELRKHGIEMPDPIELGFNLRPDHGKRRWLVPKGVYQVLQAARQTSPLWSMMPLIAARRFLGQWYKLPALRGVLGTKTLRRVARNAVTDVSSIAIKHPEGIAALRTILRPDVMGATHRVLSFLNEANEQAAGQKWQKLTPFEQSIAHEMRLYGTTKTGLFTHELARDDPRWIRELLPKEEATLSKVIRTLVGDHELAQKIDDYGENFFKVALFLRERMARFRHETLPQEGLPEDLPGVRAAHLRVGETLVSYKWLTPAERVAFSGILVPFYTWAKGNLQGVVASLIRQPGKVATRAGLAFALVQMWNHLMFPDEEEMLRSSHPDVASRLHFFTGVHDEFGQPLVLDFEDSLTEALGFMWGLNTVPAKLINALQHGDPSLFMRDIVVGGAEEGKRAFTEWLAPWVRGMAGQSYASKYVTLGERVENVFEDDLATSWRPLADLRSLGLFGDAQDKSLGQKVTSFLPFTGFVDTSEAVPAEQQSGQLQAGRLQRADARIGITVKRNMKRFLAGMESDDREAGSAQMRSAFDSAWSEVGPAMTEQGRSPIHLLARFVESAEREMLKRRTAKEGGPLPPKFHTLSRSQKAEFLLWLLAQQRGSK